MAITYCILIAHRASTGVVANPASRVRQLNTKIETFLSLFAPEAVPSRVSVFIALKLVSVSHIDTSIKWWVLEKRDYTYYLFGQW